MPFREIDEWTRRSLDKAKVRATRTGLVCRHTHHYHLIHINIAKVRMRGAVS
jgi:hypothetical protein